MHVSILRNGPEKQAFRNICAKKKNLPVGEVLRVAQSSYLDGEWRG